MPEDAKSTVAVLRAECDSCEFLLTREEVKERIEDSQFLVTDEKIRGKFASLSEGHAYFNRGHKPYYVREGDDAE